MNVDIDSFVLSDAFLGDIGDDKEDNRIVIGEKFFDEFGEADDGGDNGDDGGDVGVSVAAELVESGTVVEEELVIGVGVVAVTVLVVGVVVVVEAGGVAVIGGMIVVGVLEEVSVLEFSADSVLEGESGSGSGSGSGSSGSTAGIECVPGAITGESDVVECADVCEMGMGWESAENGRVDCGAGGDCATFTGVMYSETAGVPLSRKVAPAVCGVVCAAFCFLGCCGGISFWYQKLFFKRKGHV